ncbi:hypothetical protein ACTFIW_003380 [Dictyostelium discoideum]
MADIKVKKEEKTSDEFTKLKEAFSKLNKAYEQLKDDYKVLEDEYSIEKGKREEGDDVVQTMKIELAVQKSKVDDQIIIIESSKKELNESNVEKGKWIAKYEDLVIKYKEEGGEKEKPSKENKERDGDSRAKSLNKEAVDEVVAILIEEGPAQFFKRIDYFFRNSKIASDYKKIDELINNVFYQRENCTVYHNAVLNEVETNGDNNWETVSKAIEEADDELARREKNVQKINQARRLLKDSGEGYDNYIDIFKRCKNVWERDTYAQQVQLFSRNLSVEIGRKFNTEVATAKADGKYHDKKIEHWFNELKRIVTIQKEVEASVPKFSNNYQRNNKSYQPYQPQQPQQTQQTQQTQQPQQPQQTQQPQQQYNRNSNKTQSYERQNAKYICFHCQKEGHSARDCPSKQSPQRIAMRVCINNNWVHALVDTGCNTNLINTKLVTNEMNRSDCRVKVRTPIDHNVQFATQRVTSIKGLNVGKGTATTSVTFFAIPMEHDIVLGLDFIGGSDISLTDNDPKLVKYFKNKDDGNMVHKIKIPLFNGKSVGDRKTTVVSTIAKTDLKGIINNKHRLGFYIIKLIDVNIPKPPSQTQPQPPKLQVQTTPQISQAPPQTPSPVQPPPQHQSTPPQPRFDERTLEVQREIIKEKFKDILITELPMGFTPPERPDYDMRVNLIPNSKPVKITYGKRSPGELAKLIEKKDELLKNGIIQPSTSAYQTAAFLAKDERFVLDYRELNNQTVEFSYPMPDAEAILTKTGKAKIYSKIDFKAGFHQLNLETSSRDKTAFSLGGSLYEFTRAPFGMKNSPAYFNRWVQDVIREFKDFAEGYVDDIIVFSNSVEEHIRHLNLLLTKLRANKIYLNSKKCLFFVPEVEFVGHTISADGIKVKASKVDAILDIPVPTTIKEVKSFLGSCNYYRKFIPRYTELTFRLTELTKSRNYTKLVITDEIKKDVADLKKALTSAPLLKKPDHTRPFFVYVDASNVGTGCMITQRDEDGHEQPILYHSKKFDKYQRSYSTTEREL